MKFKDGNEVVVIKKGKMARSIIVNGVEMKGVKNCIVKASINPLNSTEEVQITLGKINSLKIERLDDWLANNLYCNFF